MGRKSSAKSSARPPSSEPPSSTARSSTPLLVAALAVIVAIAVFAYTRSVRDVAATESGPTAAVASTDAAQAAPSVPLKPHKQANLPPLPFQAYAPPRPPDVVRAAYVFAAEHPEILSYVPCFCGCERSGHKGNEDCFVARRDGAGDVVEWEGAKMQMLHPAGHAPPRPVDVPILIGALGPKGRKIALDIGDGLFVALGVDEEAKQFDWVSLLFWGTVLDDGAALVRSQQALVDLAPDVRYRLDHFRSSGRVDLVQTAQVGTRDGGPFESPLLSVGVHDAAGRLVRFEVYDVDQLDQARACFEALSASADPLAIATPNAAFALERWQVAFDAGIASDDWDAMRDFCAAGMIFDDRRRLALLSGDREMMIASARERVRSGGRPEFRLVGTAGDRVTVSRTLWSGGPPDGRRVLVVAHGRLQGTTRSSATRAQTAS
jgi:hypothetical protein